MQVVCFQLPHVFTSDSNPLENARVLRALLDTLIAVDMAYLQARPGKVAPLYKSGVRYGRTEDWLPIPAMYATKIADCKSLAAARVAELRLAGVDASPDFRWERAKNRDGNNYHILVRRTPGPDAPNGFEDPSARLGMGRNEMSYFK